MDGTAKRRIGPQWLWDTLLEVVGCISFAIGTQCFSAPNNLAPGGVTGLSILINYLTEIPISVLSFCLNIPLLLMAGLLIGRRFSLKTLKTVAISAVMLELCGRILPAYQGDMILVALCDGVLSGFGLGIIFARGSTTGGTDVASRLIQLKFPHISVGKLMLAVDAGILLLSAVVFRGIQSALYAMITIFVTTRLIDGILYGLDTGRVMMILSEKHEAIRQRINSSLERGCTILEARGGFTDQQRPVVMCAVRKQQLYDLKALVHEVDPEAFLIALEADEIIGEGFRSMDQINP